MIGGPLAARGGIGGVLASGVRRAAAITPSDLPDLAVWLDAATLNLTNADPISTWDNGGSGNDATGSGTAQPTYRTNIINGLPAARFDGSNDTLTIAGLTLGTYVTAFAVGICANSSKQLFIEHGPTANGVTGMYIYGTRNAAMRIQRDASFHTVEAPLNWLSTSAAIGMWCYDAGVFSIRKNGVEVSQAGAGTERSASDTTNTLYIMSRAAAILFSAYDLCEFVLYNRALSASERNQIGTYLASKYALTWATTP